MAQDRQAHGGGTTGWGILAPGRIAHGFARNLREVPGARVAAVGSRSRERAATFAAEFGDDRTRSHASYQELVADPDVDVVYVASPHALHAEHTRLALEAGRPVLCEKPLTINLAEATELVELARDRGVFLMEAMWMACHPVIRAVRDGLGQGRFGQPRQVVADLGWVVQAPPTDRLLAPDLGGGAALDLGVYVLTFAHLMLGPPERLRAVGTLNADGVDLDLAVAGRYADGALAALTASMSADSPRTATIATDRGRIDLARHFHHPAYATFTPADGEPQPIAGLEPLLGTGLGNEAAEVMRCLRAGLVESPLVPHAQSLSVMAQLDEVRTQIGVHYRADTRADG